MKLYIEDLGKLLDLQSGHRDILPHVAANVAYDGLVSMTTLRKNRIAAALNCSIRSIDNAITEFVKREILIPEVVKGILAQSNNPARASRTA